MVPGEPFSYSLGPERLEKKKKEMQAGHSHRKKTRAARAAQEKSGRCALT